MLLCPKLAHLILDRPPGPYVEPLLASGIGTSLLTLELPWQAAEELSYAQQMLPEMKSLRNFRMFGHPLARVPQEFVRNLLFNLPTTVQLLGIDFLNPETSKILTDLLHGDVLPELKSLYLSNIQIYQEIDAQPLGLALRTPSGRKLNTLLVGVFHSNMKCDWPILSRILSVSAADASSEVLPNLQTLIIDSPNWANLGKKLFQGCFPRLEEIRGARKGDYPSPYYNISSGCIWYCVDTEVTKIWLTVMKHRPNLRVFGSSEISFEWFRDWLEEDPEACRGFVLGLMREVLSGLMRPLQPSVVSCIEHIDLGLVQLDRSTLQTLAGAIRSQNLAYVVSLELVLSDKGEEEPSLIALGSVLHSEYLPRLRSLALGLKSCQPSRAGCMGSWEGLFQAMPADGLKNLETLRLEARDKNVAVGSVLQACSSNLFNGVTALFIEGSLGEQSLLGLSKALLAGAFPALTSLSYSGKS